MDRWCISAARVEVDEGGLVHLAQLLVKRVTGGRGL